MYVRAYGQTCRHTDVHAGRHAGSGSGSGSCSGPAVWVQGVWIRVSGSGNMVLSDTTGKQTRGMSRGQRKPESKNVVEGLGFRGLGFRGLGFRV